MQEVAGARLPCQHHGGHVPDDLLLLALGHGREPLLQAQLPLTAEEQQEAHLTTQGQRGGHKPGARRSTQSHSEGHINQQLLTHTEGHKGGTAAGAFINE